MKKIIVSCFAAISLYLLFENFSKTSLALEDKDKITLNVERSKNEFVLGEVVNLNIEYLNKSEKKQAVCKNALDSGVIKMLVKKDKDYRQYRGGGKKMCNFVDLSPEESISFKFSALWNGKPNYSHLNFEAAKRADKADNKILTDLVFPETGEYLVKIVSYYQTAEDAKNIYKSAISIESEPIRITIVEPKGEDLEVWNQIKGNKEIAVLMQFDKLNTSDSDEKTKIINQVEQIIERYPNSTYSAYLKPSLEKFKAHDSKQEEVKAKIKAQAKP